MYWSTCKCTALHGNLLYCILLHASILYCSAWKCTAITCTSCKCTLLNCTKEGNSAGLQKLIALFCTSIQFKTYILFILINTKIKSPFCGSTLGYCIGYWLLAEPYFCASRIKEHFYADFWHNLYIRHLHSTLI